MRLLLEVIKHNSWIWWVHWIFAYRHFLYPLLNDDRLVFLLRTWPFNAIRDCSFFLWNWWLNCLPISKKYTKLYIISSSEHLLLPIPWRFQHSVSLEKYSLGIRGRWGTTFFTIDRISLRSTRYLGGGPIESLITKINYNQLSINVHEVY